MRRTTRVAAALALAGVAACSRGGRAVEDGESATQEAKVGVAQDQRALDEAANKDKQDEGPGNPRNTIDPVSGMTQAGPFTTLNNSGVSGNFSLLPEEGGKGTVFNVSVNAPAGASGGFLVTLNRGPCSSLGPVVQQVGQIAVGSATVGSQRFTVPLEPAQVMNGENALVVSAGQASKPAACGTLPRNAPIPGTTGTVPPPPNGT